MGISLRCSILWTPDQPVFVRRGELKWLWLSHTFCWSFLSSRRGIIFTSGQMPCLSEVLCAMNTFVLCTTGIRYQRLLCRRFCFWAQIKKTPTDYCYFHRDSSCESYHFHSTFFLSLLLRRTRYRLFSFRNRRWGGFIKTNNRRWKVHPKWIHV